MLGARLLAALDRRLELRVVIWAFPAAFLLHDIEEILTMERHARQYPPPVPAAFRDLARVTTPQVVVAVAYEFVLCCAVSALTTRRLRRGLAMNLYATAVAILFLNVLTHLGQSLRARHYTPGLLTAPTIALPYTLYLCRRLRRAGLLDRRALGGALVGGGLAGLPVVVSALWLGRLATRRRD